MNSESILEKLVGFDTVSHRSNIALMNYVSGLLGSAGIATQLIPNGDGSKANLLASKLEKQRVPIVASQKLAPFSHKYKHS